MLRLISFALALLAGVYTMQAQCTDDGNVALFSNYDGGYLIIEINEDIPNLKIGISSYEPVEVSFAGPFVDNITEVIYAGYHPFTGTGNFHCDNSLEVTTVEEPPNANVQVLDYPPVTLITPDVPIFPGSSVMVPAGNNNGIIGCSSCVNDEYQGGSNTSEQIIDFFMVEFGGELRFLKTQYSCWCGAQNMDIPASCCFELNPNASVSISADPGLSLCDGGSVTLDAGPGYLSYLWSTGEGSQSIEVDMPGVYSVEVESPCGNAQNSIEILVEESPNLDLSLAPAWDCLGGEAMVAVTNLSGPFDFIWTDENANILGSDSASILSLPSGEYTVEVIDQNSGCSSLQMFTIADAGPAFETFVESFSPGCDGNPGSISVVLTAFLQGDYTYQLTDENGDLVESGTIENTQLIESLNAGMYQLEIALPETNCFELFDLSLSSEAPVLSSFQLVDVSCFGAADGAISVVLENGLPPYSFNWLNASDDSVSQDASLQNAAAGDYTLEVTDAAGCLAEFEFTIGSPPDLLLTAVGQNPGCDSGASGSISLSATGGTAPYTYSIQTDLFQTAAVFEDLEPGSYQPVVEDANGCQVAGEELILSDDAPEVTISASANALGMGELFQLTALVTGGAGDLTYFWQPANGLSCISCPNPEALAIESTTYLLTVTTIDGCTATDSIFIQVEPNLQLYIPNAFSPNNDGVNDHFQVYPGPGVLQISLFQIFDRWGALVYDQANDPQKNGWDGNFRGKKMAPGVYTIQLRVEYLNGQSEILGRSLTLIR
ncbi:MAG: T9SS type B sorting domain-containing protein [Bacteroidetes bacterium]|nr:T9SS type B sorting domain-containing protein [Bacteroidota bacterium]